MTNTYSLPFARSLEHTPKHPERTAVGGRGLDVIYREFRTADAMRRFCDRDAEGRHNPQWRPWAPRRRP